MVKHLMWVRIPLYFLCLNRWWENLLPTQKYPYGNSMIRKFELNSVNSKDIPGAELNGNIKNKL